MADSCGLRVAMHGDWRLATGSGSQAGLAFFFLRDRLHWRKNPVTTGGRRTMAFQSEAARKMRFEGSDWTSLGAGAREARDERRWRG